MNVLRLSPTMGLLLIAATYFAGPAIAQSSAPPTPLAEGRFHGVAHDGKGTATIYRFDGGKRVLRLMDFETSNGPDLYVYLVAAPDANDSDTVEKAGFVSLGVLKGNKGNQNYEIPAGVDLSKYGSVSIWCKRFAVNFATAPLKTSRKVAG